MNHIAPETAERMAQCFKDGAFELELDMEEQVIYEGTTVYHIVPRYAGDGAESVLNKLRRILARNLQNSEQEGLKK